MLEQRIGKVEGSAILELGLRKPLVAGWCEVYRRGLLVEAESRDYIR